jgi:eukaryotic translation initiation factor 2C
MVLSRLIDWYNQNKTIPLRILYYRDGVAETQYGDVKTKELKEIELAWNDFFDWRIQLNPSLSELKRPDFRLIAVIVTKRHYTRFYPFKPTDKMQSNENCKPGTLVDSCVTSPYHSDFFLQSHNGLLGTAKSAHYFILENSAKMSDAQIQDLVRLSTFPYTTCTTQLTYSDPWFLPLLRARNTRRILRFTRLLRRPPV